MLMNKINEISGGADAAAKRKQAEFISNIANRLGRKEPLDAPPEHPFRGAPDFWKAYRLTKEQSIELFMANWTLAGGEARRFASWSEAAEDLIQLVLRMEARYLLRWNQPELKAMKLEERLPDTVITVWTSAEENDLLETAAGTDIGICLADYAIAHTGSIVLMSGPDKGRSVSLLPTVFVAVIRAEDVYISLGEVLRELRSSDPGAHALPAGVHFISGPSRSADIENDLTIGVHGPGIVHAIIVG